MKKLITITLIIFSINDLCLSDDTDGLSWEQRERFYNELKLSDRQVTDRSPNIKVVLYSADGTVARTWKTVRNVKISKGGVCTFWFGDKQYSVSGNYTVEDLQ